ncbi:hypothetical protein [Selenomonas sp.]|uniref:hypothetical protein n=1 Tax=Selenomonas sp. TaxID=2053611 RepID=UPI0025E28B11|nr:hypothetical protein [Selenomonas sp.]
MVLLAPLSSRLGIPAAPLGDEHIAVGYDGMINLSETILEILAHKMFHDDIRKHVKLPYKQWWLKQKDVYIRIHRKNIGRQSAKFTTAISKSA